MSMAISSSIGAGFVQMQNMMQKMQSFKEGSTTLSKDDFTTMESDIQSSGRATPADLKAIIDNYEQIDTNGDGISYDELTSYADQNGIELKGPMGSKPPQGGPPRGGPPPEMGSNGMGPQNLTLQGNEDDQNYISTLLKQYQSTEQQQKTSNFSLYF